MFTIYARHKGNGKHTETECATLDEALLHLRELITSEIENPDGPTYWEYCLGFDPAMAATWRPVEYHWPVAVQEALERQARRLEARKARRCLPRGLGAGGSKKARTTMAGGGALPSAAPSPALPPSDANGKTAYPPLAA